MFDCLSCFHSSRYPHSIRQVNYRTQALSLLLWFLFLILSSDFQYFPNHLFRSLISDLTEPSTREDLPRCRTCQLDWTPFHLDYSVFEMGRTTFHLNYCLSEMDRSISHLDYCLSEMDRTNSYLDYCLSEMEWTIFHLDLSLSEMIRTSLDLEFCPSMMEAPPFHLETSLFQINPFFSDVLTALDRYPRGLEELQRLEKT
jgi:hypothetical protein